MQVHNKIIQADYIKCRHMHPIYSVITTQGSVSVGSHTAPCSLWLSTDPYHPLLLCQGVCPLHAKKTRPGAISQDFPCRSSLPLSSCFFKILSMI